MPDDPLTAAWWLARRDAPPPGMPVRPPGRHRAEGLSGPPRHYLAIVVLLAGTASLPLVTAIVTGPNSAGDTAFADASPFLAPPSGGPVVLPPGSPPAGQPPQAIPDVPLAEDAQPGPTVVRPPAATYRLSAESVRRFAPPPSPRAARVEREQPSRNRRPWPVRLPWASPAPAPSPTPTRSPAPSSTPTGSPSPTPDPTPSPTLDPSSSATTPGPAPN